ncbi:MAG: winged helix DNA-binding domain-containing protein [Chloroflexota bacterium]|nr:winged helix DNA-binding domain-containing protein [Chloroflexota bacterium]
MLRIDDRQRRARLGPRHHLAPWERADGPVEVAGDLAGLHASDPGSVYLAAYSRTSALEVGTLERALYEERSLLKVLGMRRTMFVVPVELAAVINSACTRAIGRQERRRLVRMLEGIAVAADAERWLGQVEAATMAALEARGEATAAELTREVPELRTQISFGEGRKWAGTVGLSTRVLFLLAAEGRIIRARPRGSWISSLYRWAPMDGWVRGGLGELPPDDARRELVRRWLAAFGPGTLADLRWWTGWTVGEVRRALEAIDVAEVDLDGATGLVLANDLEPVDETEPWAALLPALDSTVMGWTARGWFLGEHGPALFDRNGNAGPTVWWDGRVVGGWGQSASGEVVFRLLEDVGFDAVEAIESAAARLSAWLGRVRITPRFRTPLELELSR